MKVIGLERCIHFGSIDRLIENDPTLAMKTADGVNFFYCRVDCECEECRAANAREEEIKLLERKKP